MLYKKAEFFRLFVLFHPHINIRHMILKNIRLPFVKHCRNIIIIFVILLFSLSAAYGQKQKEQAPPLRERLFFGGSFGLQFGTVTYINIAPIAGLWVLPRVAVAAGPEYIYYQEPDYYNGGPDFKMSIYGAKFYTQFVVIQNLNSFLPIGANTGIFLHLEDEYQNREDESSTGQNMRFNVNTLLGGGGISQQIGRRSSINLMFLWVLDDGGYPIYSNPEIRISFTF